MSTSITPATPDPWAPLRATTQARIGLGRAGMALPTAAVLDLQTSQAAARDAVHVPLNVDALLPGLTRMGLGEPILLTSKAADRSIYLRRPDLGREPAQLDALPTDGAQVALVIADGLSSKAVADHTVAMVQALVTELSELTIAPPVIVTQARVAIGDWIGQAMGVDTVLVLIGERPGLSVADSLGIYLTHNPRPGRNDAERNCISNIHPPEGLSYASAAATAARLVRGARELGRSGVDLKDTAEPAALDG